MNWQEKFIQKLARFARTAHITTIIGNILSFLHIDQLFYSFYHKSIPYYEGGLASVHNHDFMKNPRFISAYNKGIQATGIDYHWRWRVHVGLWAATHASKLQGDFVECGVEKGFLSSAIINYLDWNKLDKTIYLFDTFHGLDESIVSEEEIALGRLEGARERYTECYETAKKNFKKIKRVVLIRGSVPGTLKSVLIRHVSYLSIDMNNYVPEIAAAEFFWPKMVHGAIMLLDDYAFLGFHPEKKAFDTFAKNKGIEILSLPTGQGLIIKP